VELKKRGFEPKPDQKVAGRNRAGKSVDDATRELAEAVQDLKRKLQTLATVSGQSYDLMIDECVMAVAEILWEGTETISTSR
jgi:hypothetical protein